MKPRLKRVFLALAILIVAGVIYMDNFGLYPRYFDIGWDEEVQLHDGRVILVNVKYTYERLSRLTFDRYDRTILRNTEFSFDAGPPIGRFTQLFQKHRVDMVEYFNGKWYLLLQTAGVALILKTETGWKEDWGSAQNSSGQKCWSLDERGLAQASINDLPDEILKINMLMDGAPVGELAALDGTRVTLHQKAELLRKYRLNPSEAQIERPQSNVTRSR